MSNPTTPTAPVLADGGAITEGSPQPTEGLDPNLVNLLAMCPNSWQGDEGFIQWAKRVYEAGGAAATPPAPVISSIAPTDVAAGATGLTLKVAGTGFSDGATVLVGGAAQPTTIGASAALEDALLATAGTLPVQVKNADGALSNTIDLTVT